jgi:hypothetical protein
MNTKIVLSLAALLIIPVGTQAQQNAPIFDRKAATAVIKGKDVTNSVASLKNLELSRLKLTRSLGFEDGPICVTSVPIAAPNIDVHRTLFVHDDATLSAGNFSLRHTLQKLSSDVSGSVPGITPESIFRQFMDTQNDTPNQATPGNPHCSDNNGKVNGFPMNKCPRPEGIEAVGAPADITNRIDNDYKPIALVNRIDLADKGWKNCGEHRIVYGKNNGGKNLIIFEAVLPNPKPGCRSGCRDVIDFWLDLSSDSNPGSRAAKLENFYYNGLPGFRPVVHTSHYSSGVSSVYGGSGSGQIRTNQFLFRSGMGQGPWTLKEFKTFLSCAGGTCDYDILPSSVKVNPYGVLWNRDVATGAVVPALPAENSYATAIPGLATLATDFQADVLAQVSLDRLANPDINSITYEVKPNKNAAESQSQGPVIDDYPGQFSAATDATFRNSLDTLAAGFGLTGAQIVNRATANSCAGCHLPNGFGLTNANSIGPGMSWPSALAFVHVDTPPLTSLAGQPGFDPAQFGGNAQGFNISPALLNEFLPARRNNLTNLSNMDVCDCVPKPSLLSINKTLIPKQKVIIGQSNERLKSQLAAANKSFITKRSIKTGDARQLFQEQKAIIAKTEVARNAELDKAGLKLVPPSLKAEPINLTTAKLPADSLMKLKTEKLKELVNAEPPRESITGSFRSH